MNVPHKSKYAHFNIVYKQKFMWKYLHIILDCDYEIDKKQLLILDYILLTALQQRKILFSNMPKEVEPTPNPHHIFNYFSGAT